MLSSPVSVPISVRGRSRPARRHVAAAARRCGPRRRRRRARTSRPVIRRSLGGWPLRRRATVAYLALVALGLLGLGYAIATYGALNDALIRLTDRLSTARIAYAQWTEALPDADRGLRRSLLTAAQRLQDRQCVGSGKRRQDRGETGG